MKTLAIATLGLVLAGTSVTALAGSQDREHLTQCKNAVTRVLGEDTDVKLKGQMENSFRPRSLLSGHQPIHKCLRG